MACGTESNEIAHIIEAFFLDLHTILPYLISDPVAVKSRPSACGVIKNWTQLQPKSSIAASIVCLRVGMTVGTIPSLRRSPARTAACTIGAHELRHACEFGRR